MGSAYALERGDIFTPLIRNLGAIFVRGGQPRDVLCPVHGQGDRAHRRPRPQHALRLDHRGRQHAVGDLDARGHGPHPGGRRHRRAHAGHGARWPSPGSATAAPPPAPSTRGSTSPACRRRPSSLIVENNKWAYSTPTAKQTANTALRGPRPRLRLLRRAGGRQRRAGRVRGHPAARSSARARGRGPDPDRGRHHAHARPRRARRHEVRAARSMLEEWAKQGPDRRATSGGSLASGIATPGELDGDRGRARRARSQEDLAWAEASPMPDPETGLVRRLRRPRGRAARAARWSRSGSGGRAAPDGGPHLPRGHPPGHARGDGARPARLRHRRGRRHLRRRLPRHRRVPRALRRDAGHRHADQRVRDRRRLHRRRAHGHAARSRRCSSSTSSPAASTSS